MTDSQRLFRDTFINAGFNLLMIIQCIELFLYIALRIGKGNNCWRGSLLPAGCKEQQYACDNKDGSHSLIFQAKIVYFSIPKHALMISYLFYLLVYPILLLGSIFTGRKTAERAHRRSHQWKPLGVENGLMGFFALLVSFTLVQSGNHFKERVDMGQRLADELSELLRITQTLDPGMAERIRAFTFKAHRVMLEYKYHTKGSVYEVIARVEGMDKELDKYLLAYIKNSPAAKTEIVNIMVKIDHVESVAYRILHSYHRSIPVFILFVLVLYSLLIGFMLGFIGKYYQNHIHISTSIFVIISFITINFIHDLDSPSQGFIKPDFQDITDVVNMYK